MDILNSSVRQCKFFTFYKASNRCSFVENTRKLELDLFVCFILPSCALISVKLFKAHGWFDLTTMIL